jgi:hypothetical protein
MRLTEMPPREPAKSLGQQLLAEWRGSTPQNEACDLIGTDKTTYCRFESGQRRPGGWWAAEIEKKTRGKVPARSWYDEPRPEKRQRRGAA